MKDPGDVVFETPGSSTVKFIVTDKDGDISSDTVLIKVNAPSVGGGGDGGGGGGGCFTDSVHRLVIYGL